MIKLNIAGIMDRFSYDCFKYECNLLYLSKMNWKAQIRDFSPEFLFIESFWAGIDGSWEGEIKKANDGLNSDLVNLIDYCKKQGIKTVFWNKEDPPNYRLFIKFAKLFDFIFTTDEKCIPFYKRDLGHNNIWALSFAAQPLIHNPIGIDYKDKKGVAFAGSWYQNKHFYRQVEMEMLLKGAIEYNLIIYDRNNTGHVLNEAYRFPMEFREYLHSALSYDEMVHAYKKHQIFLNVNTVRDSETMFSRRVYEILASGTNVISTYSVGIEKKFGSIVPLIRNKKDTVLFINNIISNKEFGEKLAIIGIRTVYNYHLYHHRLNEILSKINIKNRFHHQKQKILVISFVNNETELGLVNESFDKQQLVNVDKEHIIITNNISLINIGNVFDRADIGRLKGEIKKLKCNYITIMKSNCYYGQNYLTDMYHATIYSKADVITKVSFYAFKNNSLYKNEAFKQNTFVNIRECNVNAMFVSMRIITKSILSQIIATKDIKLLDSSFDQITCYSNNRFEFLNICNDISKLKITKHNITLQDAINAIQVIEDLPQRNKIDRKAYLNEIKQSLYSEKYPGFNKIFSNEVTHNVNGKIVIYGAGEHTLRFLNLIQKENMKLNILGIVDKNAKMHGKMIHNYRVYSPNELNDLKTNYIYISSHVYEKEIYNDIKKYEGEGVKVLKLYTDYPDYSFDIFKELYLEDYSPR